MLAEIGLAALTLAFLLAIYAVVASLAGARVRSEGWLRSGRNAALLTFPALLLAVSHVGHRTDDRRVSDQLCL